MLACAPSLLAVNDNLGPVKRAHQVPEYLLLRLARLPIALLLQSFHLHMQQLVLFLELSESSRLRLRLTCLLRSDRLSAAFLGSYHSHLPTLLLLLTCYGVCYTALESLELSLGLLEGLHILLSLLVQLAALFAHLGQFVLQALNLSLPLRL